MRVPLLLYDKCVSMCVCLCLPVCVCDVRVSHMLSILSASLSSAKIAFIDARTKRDKTVLGTHSGGVTSMDTAERLLITTGTPFQHACV